MLLISGALPQAIVLIAGVPFNATLWFFGTTELVGHLPIYGAMLAILVWGSDPRCGRWSAGCRGAGRGRRARPRPRPHPRRLIDHTNGSTDVDLEMKFLAAFYGVRRCAGL